MPQTETELEARMVRSAARQVAQAADTGLVPHADLDEAVGGLADALLEVRPDEAETELTRELHVQRGGLGPSSTRKLSNVLLNPPAALAKAASITVLLAGIASTQPWWAPIAIFGMIMELVVLADVKVGEREAAVVWTLYSSGAITSEHAKSTEEVRRLVDLELHEHGRTRLGQGELEGLLGTLIKMRCVVTTDERSAAPKYWLREHIHVEV